MSFADIFESIVPYVFAPFADDLLDRCLPVAGERVLDVACGTGIVARRVLVPGGRLAVSVWRSLEEHPFLAELERISARHLGPLAPDRRHAFGDAAALGDILSEAGFSDVSVTTSELTLKYPDGPKWVALNLMAIAPPSFANLPEDERARLVAAIQRDASDVLAAYADGSGIAVAQRANVALARA